MHEHRELSALALGLLIDEPAPDPGGPSIEGASVLAAQDAFCFHDPASRQDEDPGESDAPATNVIPFRPRAAGRSSSIQETSR